MFYAELTKPVVGGTKRVVREFDTEAKMQQAISDVREFNGEGISLTRQKVEAEFGKDFEVLINHDVCRGMNIRIDGNRVFVSAAA